MAGLSFGKGKLGQNASSPCCLRSGGVRSTSDLLSQRTGSSSQLGTRRFDVLRSRELVRPFSWTPYKSDTTGSPQHAEAHHASSRLAYSKLPRFKSIGGPLHRTPLATGISGYNKNWGYDSRRGSNESLNTHYQRKHDVPLATKQPAVRGSAGRKTGTMLLW